MVLKLLIVGVRIFIKLSGCCILHRIGRILAQLLLLLLLLLLLFFTPTRYATTPIYPSLLFFFFHASTNNVMQNFLETQYVAQILKYRTVHTYGNQLQM